MTLDQLGLCCPACRGDLAGALDGDGELRCLACDRRYPVIAGIPDLRVRPDPYITPEQDREKGRRLAARAADLSFEELVRYYYSITPAVPPAHAAAYIRGLFAAEDRAAAALQQWEAGAGDGPGAIELLDVGCGTAPLLVASAARYRPVAGVDVAFRWLVIGRKRLTERGLDVPLICACAEALPFRGPVADVVTLDSALEHFADQDAALTECRRTMRPGGRLFVATPNRCSPGPDPHVGLWGGSLLPERVVAAWARRVGGVPPRRHLLHRRSLGRALLRAGFTDVRVFLPRFTRAQVDALPALRRALARLYDRLVRLPPTRFLLLRIGPVLYATARTGPAGAASGGPARVPTGSHAGSD